MDRIDKFKFWIILIIQLLLGGAISIAIWRKTYVTLMLSAIALFLTFLPTIFERRYKIDYPSEFDLVIVIFIYASLYLGEIKSYYTRYWWWDLFLHTLSGVIIGVIGFSLIYLLNKDKNLTLELSPAFIALFSFCFALSLGALWEIFEFFMDTSFGLTMQKSGLVDTMTDLLVDTIGALVVSLVGFSYLKGKFRLFERFQKKFIEKNPRKKSKK